MKKLLILLLFVYPTIVLSQEKTNNNRIVLPIDSSTNLITYQEVVDAKGATKDQLYIKGREWFAKSFKSANDVIQMDDKDAGKIIGKATSQGIYTSGGLSIPYKMLYTISITTKNNKYRYEITSFITQFTGSVMNGVSAPMEQYYIMYSELSNSTNLKGKTKTNQLNTSIEGILAVDKIGKDISSSIKIFIDNNSGNSSKDNF